MAAQQRMATASRPPEENSMEKLEELGQLHESGVLTDEEPVAAKAKIPAPRSPRASAAPCIRSRHAASSTTPTTMR